MEYNEVINSLLSISMEFRSFEFTLAKVRWMFTVHSFDFKQQKLINWLKSMIERNDWAEYGNSIDLIHQVHDTLQNDYSINLISSHLRFTYFIIMLLCITIRIYLKTSD